MTKIPCHAKTRRGTTCQRPAGWGTNHAGTGRCKLHGGASTGAPKGNQNAIKHGFFSRILPDDDETKALLNEINEKSPLDILWENIVLQYLAIVRAQRLMFVRDQNDTTRTLTREKMDMNGDVSEREWELQYAWDKHAVFLQAQSRAMATLESLIDQYQAMLPDGVLMEERRARVAKLKAEVERITSPDGDGISEDWAKALEAVAERRRQIRLVEQMKQAGG